MMAPHSLLRTRPDRRLAARRPPPPAARLKCMSLSLDFSIARRQDRQAFSGHVKPVFPLTPPSSGVSLSKTG